MKTLPLLAAAAAAHAASVTETFGPFTPGALIADNDAVLAPFLLSLSSSAIQRLSEVTLRFELRGTPGGAGFASDMVASLIRTPLADLLAPADPTAVLLNRVGVTDLNPVGYAYDGWDVTLSDGAATDIHTVNLEGGALGGGWWRLVAAPHGGVRLDARHCSALRFYSRSRRGRDRSWHPKTHPRGAPLSPSIRSSAASSSRSRRTWIRATATGSPSCAWSAASSSATWW